MTMMTGDNGVGWQANTVTGYLHFESAQLRDCFFRHCTALRRLRLVAGARSCFGSGQSVEVIGDSSRNWCEGPLPLDERDLFRLRRFELKNLFVSVRLAVIITAKSQILGDPSLEGGLRSIQLLNCHINCHVDVDSALPILGSIFRDVDGHGRLSWRQVLPTTTTTVLERPQISPRSSTNSNRPTSSPLQPNRARHLIPLRHRRDDSPRRPQAQRLARLQHVRRRGATLHCRSRLEKE